MIKVSEEQYPIIKQFISSAPTFVYSILDRMIEGAVYSDTVKPNIIISHEIRDILCIWR